MTEEEFQVAPEGTDLDDRAAVLDLLADGQWWDLGKGSGEIIVMFREGLLEWHPETRIGRSGVRIVTRLYRIA